MTNPLLTLENIRSGAVPSDAVAVGFLLGEIERLYGLMHGLEDHIRQLQHERDSDEPKPQAPTGHIIVSAEQAKQSLAFRHWSKDSDVPYAGCHCYTCTQRTKPNAGD